MTDSSCRSIKNLLLSVVELRATDWGSKVAQVPAAHTFTQQPLPLHEHYGVGAFSGTLIDRARDIPLRIPCIGYNFSSFGLPL